MPQVIYVDRDDEVSDVIDRVRGSGDQALALVFTESPRVILNALNLRLLAQFSRSAGKETAIVTGNPREQELARAAGFSTYASVQAYERGIELVRPHHGTAGDDPGAGGVALAPAPVAAVAVAAPPPPAPRPPATRPPLPGRERRRPFYYVAIAVAVVGLLLFLFVAPSAKITITVAATPLSASPTIQGSTDQTVATAGDHLLTGVVTSDQGSQFTATPTGQKTLPAVTAAATVKLRTALPTGASLTIPKGEEFDTRDTPPLRFYATQDTPVCIGPTVNGADTPAQQCPDNATPNSLVPVQDGTPEARGNVAAGAISRWPGNPCDPRNVPQGQPLPACGIADFSVTNPQAATGGADQKQITVVSDQDLAGWNSQVAAARAQLTDRLNADMAARAPGRQFAVDPSGSGKTITFDVRPPLPKSGDQFPPTGINITGHSKAAIFSTADVRRVVIADLSAQIPQGDTLAADKLHIQTPNITEASDDGTVVLSVTATGYAEPSVDLPGLAPQLTGKGPDDARHIIEHRIGSQVTRVDVQQKPFGLFFLPFFSSRIELDESFVAQTAT